MMLKGRGKCTQVFWRTLRQCFARLGICAALLSVLLMHLHSALADAGTESRDAGVAETGASVDLVRNEFSALQAQPVHRVQVVLQGNAFRDTPLPSVTVPPGTLFSDAEAREWLRAVLATGKFGSGDVSAILTPAGVDVTLSVLPRRIVTDIVTKLSGARLGTEDFLRECDLARDQEITGASLEEINAKARGVFARHGYPSATVTVGLSKSTDDLHVVLNITVLPGEPRFIERRVFDITKGETESAPLESYAIGSGDSADEGRLDLADTELQNKLRGLGFFDAVVSHAVGLERNIVTLRVTVALGVFSVARFDGNQSYDEGALTGALGLASDSDRSAGHLVDKLRQFYGSRGFLDAEIAFEERTQQSPSTPRRIGSRRTVLFHIRENARVRVKERTYPCFKPSDFNGLETEVAPRTASAVGNEIDSFLEDELPGADFIRTPRPEGLTRAFENAESHGSRPTPIELNANETFASETYARSIAHVQELLRADGYLSALVGPLQVVRHQCSRKSPPGECTAVPFQAKLPEVCPSAADGLPLPVPELDAAFTCIPDPARGISCEPVIGLRIPIHLGPRTRLYDAVFQGVKSEAPSELLKESGLLFGHAASQLKVDDARRKLAAFYQEDGFAYVQVRSSLELSSDHSRARVVFDIIEGDRVRIRDIVIRGNTLTVESVIRRRLAMQPGDIFRTSNARKSQERISTLGTFSSVNIALDDPFVPEALKIVVVTVVEPVAGSQTGEIGVSSGEGFRLSGELGYRNVFGRAIGASVSAQLSYLPTAWVLDQGVQKNFSGLPLSVRIPVRVVGSLQFPEIGLGPLMRSAVDIIFVHDLQRDYYIRKFAAVPSFTFTPQRDLRISIGQSIEYNDVRIFQQDFQAFQRQLRLSGLGDRLNALLVPDGSSVVSAQKLTFSWDRRDNALDATKGSLVAASIEHVDAFSLNDPKAGGVPDPDSHFLKFTQTLAGYAPLYKRLRLGVQVRAGVNVQLTKDSVTYTDRLFFLGGADSMRAWFPSTFIPQDDADLIEADQNKTVGVPVYGPRPGTFVPDPTRFTAQSRPVRGGNLLFNPRVELRIPVLSSVETAVFADIGNLWTEARYPFDRRSFPMRASLGGGVRLITSVFPIAFDVGFNPWKRRYDDRSWAFNFSIGLF
jgi:outer membrane protein insertion porin family